MCGPRISAWHIVARMMCGPRIYVLNIRCRGAPNVRCRGAPLAQLSALRKCAAPDFCIGKTYRVVFAGSCGLALGTGRVPLSGEPLSDPPLHGVRPPSSLIIGRWSGGGSRAFARTNRRTRDESQWIVATRPLCHLQYPVRYLSRLQRIYLPQYAELRCAMVLGLRLSVPSHIGGGRIVAF
jgi:hypothetical protein